MKGNSTTCKLSVPGGAVDLLVCTLHWPSRWSGAHGWDPSAPDQLGGSDNTTASLLAATRRCVFHLLTAYPRKFELIYSGPDYSVYHVKSGVQQSLSWEVYHREA